MKHLQTCISGLFAGILISIGGLVSTYLRSLSADNVIPSAIFFAFGLLTICIFSFSLYTGKIAYVIEQRKLSYCTELLEMLFGNILGCVLMGQITRLLRIFPTMESTFLFMCEAKNADTWYSLFFLSFFCGILVYIAIEIFRSEHEGIIRIIGLIFSVSIFVILGFEHVIADIYYYSAANAWNLQSFGNILIIFLGNSLGAIGFHHLRKLIMKNT